MIKTEDKWRTAYEMYASVFWLIGASVSALIGFYGEYGMRFMLLSTLPMIVFGLIRFYEGALVLNQRAKIFSIKPLSITLHDVIKWQQDNPGKVWYGKGFFWEPSHTQMLTDLNAKSLSDLKPSSFVMGIRKTLGLESKYKGEGLPFLHNLEKYEADIVYSLEHRYSHESVSGTTGAGKGRKLSFDVIQAIVRGEGILVIDPKKDGNLLDLINATLEILDQKERLHTFLPNAPSKSCRINPFSNFTEITELTERTTSIFSDQKEDAFKSFAWRAVNTVLHGLNQVGEEISLKQILKYLESDIDDLLILVGRKYLSQFPEMKRVLNELDENDGNVEKKAKLVAQQYNIIKDKHPDKVMHTIMSIFAHDRSHYKKLYQNILPPLTQLTSGNIRGLLSPSKFSDDPRPIVDISTIARKGDILYVNLNSLKDKTVGNALGSLIFADTIAVISDRYFCFEEDELIPFNVYGDESSDYVNDASINLANKSRGSKSAFKFFFQTRGDLSVRLGSVEKGDQMIGNTNTITTLRSKDVNTMEKFTLGLQKTVIKRMSEGVTTQTTAAKQDIDFNTGYTKQTQAVEVPLVPPEMISYLMNMHSFTQFAGGELAKIRIPFIPCPEGMEFKPETFKYDSFGKPPGIKDLTKVRKEFIPMY